MAAKTKLFMKILAPAGKGSAMILILIFMDLAAWLFP